MINNITPTIVNAFTARNGSGGNPAAVVINDQGLTSEEKQRIAADIGLSETAFVDDIHGQSVQMSFYTPTKAIADCGHATVAAFHYLREHRFISAGNYQKIIASGERHISVTESQILLQTGAATIQPIATEYQALCWQALNIEPFSQIANTSMRIASVGAPFILCELASIEALSSIRMQRRLLLDLSATLDVIGVYVYVKTPAQNRFGNYDIATRMFAPFYGIDEESATGMAAGALTAYLHQRDGTVQFIIAQGDWLQTPSPSRLYTEVKQFGHNSADIWVGGAATIQN